MVRSSRYYAILTWLIATFGAAGLASEPRMWIEPALERTGDEPCWQPAFGGLLLYENPPACFRESESDRSEDALPSQTLGPYWDPYWRTPFREELRPGIYGALRLTLAEELRPPPANPNDMLREEATGLINASPVWEWVPGVAVRTGAAAYVHTSYDTGFVASNTRFLPTAIALDGTKAARQQGRFQMSAEATTVFVDLQPKFVPGQPQAYAEFDFLEGDIRMRHGYGAIDLGPAANPTGSLFVGTGWTTFGDDKERPQSITLDGAPCGSVFRRPVQIRYTVLHQGGLSTAIAMEQPTVDDLALIDAVNDVALQRWPDVVARLRYDRPEDTLNRGQLAVLIRQLGLEDIAGQETFVTGWGLSAFARVRVRDKNNLQLGLVGGEGLGSYLFGLSGMNVKSAAGPDVDGTLTVLPNLGWYTGYQHYWSASMLTNVVYGYAHADTNTAFAALTPRTTQNAWLNLLVKMTPTFAVGVEYQYGMLETRNGSQGDDHRVEMVMQVGAPASGASPTLTRF